MYNFQEKRLIDRWIDELTNGLTTHLSKDLWATHGSNKYRFPAGQLRNVD